MTEYENKELLRLTKEDLFYQDLLRQCRQLEPEFLRIRGSLPPADQELLDLYIAICEDMEYRRTCLALAIE